MPGKILVIKILVVAQMFLANQIAGFHCKCNILSDQIDFLFADKKRFLQVSATAFDGRGHASPKYPK